MESSVFDIPSWVLECVMVVDAAKESATDVEVRRSSSDLCVPPAGCITCGLTALEDRKELIEHFRSDWHIVNLKRRLVGRPPMALAQWEECRNEILGEQSGDSDNEDVKGAGGNSGDDSDEDDLDENLDAGTDVNNGGALVNCLVNAQDLEEVTHIVTKSNGPQLAFRLPGTSPPMQLVISRCIFPVLAQKWSPWRVLSEVVRGGIVDSNAHKWFVLLMQSGKLAAAIFDGQKTIAHKCFRRYTIRAKSGGAQSASDSSGAKAQSMGASLRRYNEQKLKEDLWQLLQAWSDEIGTCHLLLASISKNMRPVLFAKESPVDKGDPRLRWVPFAVQKPTLDEVKRVHRVASVVYVRNVDEAVTADEIEPEGLGTIVEEERDVLEKEATKAQFPPHPPPDIPLNTVWDEDDERLNELGASLIQACLLEDGDSEKDMEAALSTLLTKLYHEDGLDANDVRLLLNRSLSDSCGETVLHVASRTGNAACVLPLLQGGAAPDRRTERNRTAYSMAKDKATRDAFRRARGVLGEDWAEWDKAGVPPAVDEDQDERKKLKEREKKKRAKQRKKEEKDRAQATLVAAERAQQEEEARRLALHTRRQSDPNYQCRSCHVYLHRLASDSQPVCKDPGCAKAYRRHLMASAVESRLAGAK